MFLYSSDEDFVDPEKEPSTRDALSGTSSQPDKDEMKRQKKNEKNARYRARMTGQQKLLEAKATALRMKKSRENQTPEKQQMERDKARERMAQHRLPTLTKIKPKDGLRCQDVLNGTFRVARLESTPDGIGPMDVECQYCGALKFRKETSTTCCSDGKVLPAVFPRPPDDLMNLWSGTDARSRMLRQHSRMINNAVCLSSLKVKLRTFQGFTPSIVFQGRVQHRAGALLPADGEPPRFAQLYVYDPAMETTHRFENMVVPTSLSNSQKAILKDLLQNVQDVLHQVNPFVRDFKQIIDLPEQDVAEGKIVISAKTPVGEHPRRYNTPTTLQEVSILMNPGKHDLIIQKRGGGLVYIGKLFMR